MWGWSKLLGLCAAVTVGQQLLTFLVAFYLQIDKLTDISGASNFVLLAWLSFALGPASGYTRPLVNTLLVTVWGIRLGGYLLRRVIKRGHDARFDEARGSFTAFGAFFVFQALWVFIVTLPVVLLNATKHDVPLGARDGVGWALWALGFVFEVAADASKDAFMADPTTRGGRIIMSGVWGVTRHPNYFGEITLWLGLFLSCSSAFDAPNSLPGAYAAGALSPLFTAVILLFLSGMPLGEERYNRRYGREPWYLLYRAQTSPLLPLPPAVYQRLPLPVKRALLLELPLYEKGLPGPVDLSPSTSARLPTSGGTGTGSGAGGPRQ